MADTDLFMECEEEELEPWQMIEDDVVDDTGGGMLLAATNNLSAGIKSGVAPVSVGDLQNNEVEKKTMLAVLSPNSNVGGSLVNSSGQPLIVAQNPAGLGPHMTMPPIYSPTAMQVLQESKPGATSNVSGQPIFITTQGFTMKDLRSVQNPVGIVLNVQGGQGTVPYQTKPLTLVPGMWSSAPATTQFVKSAVGVPQLWSPVTSIRPATNTFPGSVTTVIPATVTIRSTVPPVAQKPPAQTSPTQSHLQPKCLTQALASLPPSQSPHSHIQPPAQARPQAHPHCQPSILHHPHALQLPNHDHKLVNFLQNTNLIRLKATEPASAEVRTKPEELLKSSVPPPVQITNTTTSTAAASPQITHKNTLNHTTPFKLPENNMNNGVPIPMDCPKCNIHFNILESLKVHMAYCCPQLLNPPTPAKAPQQQPHQAPPPPPPPAPPPTPPAVQQQPSVKLAEPSQGKLIMLVDDFYYGRDEGSTYQMLQEMKSSTTFRCLSCLKRLKNNIRFMNHMKHHLELEQQNDDTIENHTTCHHCFRQYATPFQLQCHIENVHSPYETTTKCKICELAFETEQLFLQHMKDTHKPGEMPYVCQVCEYRSSVYLEVDSHFRMIHEDTKNLLCPYCFKVVKNSSAYQQHYMKHQKKSVYPCNKCRLQFISAKEKMEHKVEHHKTFKKPKQLEGLQPGTKVTIRTSMGQARAAGGPVQEIPARKVYPPVLPPKPQEAPACSTVHKVAPAAPKPAPKAEKRKAVERISPLLMDMQEIRRAYGNQVCLECNIDITNVSCISNHFPTYVHCSRCRYSTSCSRAYADHMISYHTQRGKPKYLMFGKVKKSAVLLVCTSCTFAVETGDGDEMAQHLDQNPGHGPCCFVTFAVGERRGRSARVTEEEAPASEPRPSTPDFEIEEEESVGVQDSSAEREANDDSPGPPADEIQKPVAKSQQVKTVRLSTVCSTNYINAKISSRPPVAASPPPAPSKDAEASSPIYVEGEKSSSGAIYIAEDKNGSSPEYVAEDKIGSSPTYVAEDENDSSLVCVQEGKRRLTPDCVDEERSLTPECVEEERSSTPGCVEEDQRSLTPECVEEERSSTPGFVEERSSTPGFVEERSSTPGFVEERSLTPECVDEERSLTPECVDEERSLTPECVDEERSLTPECVDEERSLTPECVDEERSLSPGFVEERSLTPECVDEERSLTPECVDEETSLNPECAEEERSLTPGCVEEDKRRLTPEGNEVKRRLSPVSAEEDSQLSKGGDDSESQPKDVPWTRKPLSEHEFRVVLHALCCGMQAATERYGASRSQVEHLLNECAQQLDLSSGAEAGSRLLSPEAEEQLVEWVLVQRERQLPLTEETFLHRLSKLLGPRGAEPAAPSSCLWAVGFLLRHNLIAYAKITVARKLPREMEESVQSFVEFAQQQIVGRDFPYCMIGNMDEIPIFLDPEALRRPEGTPGGLEVAGTGEPQFVIVFTILADGNLLPTMIFSRGGLPPWLKVPAGILLEVKEAGYSEAEVLELWLAKVWRRHMATRYRRTMLVLDSSRRHLSDDFIDHLSRCNSLPLVVPGGCTSRAQPLDMCIGQTLRSFLQKRWAEYSREAACFRDVYGDVLQSLLNWVAEVAGFVASNADVVQQSFLLASVLPGPGGRPASVQQKVEAQEELVSFLQEQLELSGKLEECGDGKAPPTLALDPRLLTRLFEADSEAESFYGFSEGDL